MRTIRSSFAMIFLFVNVNSICEVEEVINRRKHAIFLPARIVFRKEPLAGEGLKQALDPFRIGAALAFLQKALGLRIAIAPCGESGRGKDDSFAEAFDVGGKKIEQPNESDHLLEFRLEVGLGFVLGREEE